MSARNENITQVVSKMKDYGLGLRRKTVEIVKYNQNGAEAFLWLEQKIKAQLGKAYSYRIEHVGSTSIPDMTAKPVLDILIIFKMETKLKSAIPLLEEFGFIYKGDAVSTVQQTEPDPGRHFFSFYDSAQEVDYIHLHMFTEAHPDSIYLVQFRDELRKNSALAQEYSQIKQRLKNDNFKRHEYTLSKNAFVEKVRGLS